MDAPIEPSATGSNRATSSRARRASWSSASPARAPDDRRASHGRAGCENDVEGRFTDDPGRDSQRHGSRFLCGCCGYARCYPVGGDAPGAPTGTGATPQSKGLVRVRGSACFHTLAPPSWGRSRSNYPLREGYRAPLKARWLNEAVRPPGLNSHQQAVASAVLAHRPWQPERQVVGRAVVVVRGRRMACAGRQYHGTTERLHRHHVPTHVPSGRFRQTPSSASLHTAKDVPFGQREVVAIHVYDRGTKRRRLAYRRAHQNRRNFLYDGESNSI